jgi:RNA polymerase sigma-70 factor (ECF subfamily)
MPLASTATDAALVAAVRRGQGEAITWLVERYSPRLYRYLLRLVPDAALAEDILQDTWLRVVERLDRYDKARPFVVWVFAIARHRAIDTLRQRVRMTQKLGRPAEPYQNEEGEHLDPVDQAASAEPSPLERLATTELEQRVSQAFALLPPHYREALTLRFHEDMEMEEIAHVLGLPLSTVKTRVQRGLLLLRQRAEALGLNQP